MRWGKSNVGLHCVQNKKAAAQQNMTPHFQEYVYTFSTSMEYRSFSRGKPFKQEAHVRHDEDMENLRGKESFPSLWHRLYFNASQMATATIIYGYQTVQPARTSSMDSINAQVETRSLIIGCTMELWISGNSLAELK